MIRRSSRIGFGIGLLVVFGCNAFTLTRAADPAGEPTADGVHLADDGTYLRPNMRFSDGATGYLHVTQRDMPWVVSIGAPKSPAKYGTGESTRAAAIEGMQLWEDALRPQIDWFDLEFVHADPSADVLVEWKRRIPGPYGGFGRIEGYLEFGRWRALGRMEVSTTPQPRVVLSVDQIRLLFAHEFGHVLGLGHCLACDSAMNYSWHTRDRILVSEVDVRTFRALIAKPNGPIAAGN